MAGKLRNGDDVVALVTYAIPKLDMIELYLAKSPDRISLSACFTVSNGGKYESVGVIC